MSTSQTTNLHLVKPDDSEYPDVSVINANMDTIDAKMGAVGNTSLQGQIDALGESVSKFSVSEVKSISFNVSANGNRNISFIFYDNHVESLFFNDSGIGLYNSATGVGHGIPWSS